MPISPRLYSGVRVTNSPCLPNVRRLDGAIIPMVNRMMRNGIAVDIPYLHDLSAKLERLKQEEYANIQYHIPTEALYRFVAATTKEESNTDDDAELTADLFAAADSINLNSPDQLAALLYEHMGLGSGIQIKKTKGGRRLSTGKKQLEAIKAEHPIIASILRYREYTKLKNTYADALPKLARWCDLTKTWRIHTQFVTTRTETGRLASRHPNLQNIPARSTLGAELRAAFIASPGCVLLSRDYSQIELRILAHEANEPNMLAIFAADGDIHDASTCSLYNLSAEQWKALPKDQQKGMRTPVKNVNFGIAYSLSAMGLQQGLMVNSPPIFWSVEECQAFIDRWFILYPGVKDYMQRIFQDAQRYGMVWDMFGRIRLVPGIRSIHTWIQSAALREAGNMPIQCLKGDTKVFVHGEGRRLISSLSGEQTLWDGTQWSTGSVVKTGVKKCLKITLHNGLCLECSPDHRIFVRDPDGRESEKTAGELSLIWNRSPDHSYTSKNGRVSIRKRSNYRVCINEGLKEEWNWNSHPPLADWNKLDGNSAADLTWADEDPELFGEMLGRIASDGSVICVDYKNRFVPKVVYMLIAEHEIDIFNHLYEAAERTVPNISLRTTQKAGTWGEGGAEYQPLHRIEMYSRSLCSTFHQWGLKKRIPEYVWGNSRILRGYLRGMFDGDGGVVGLEGDRGTIMLTFGGSNGRYDLAHDIQQALLMLGIRSRLRVYPSSIRLGIQKADNSKFLQQVGFLSKKKTAKALGLGQTTRFTTPTYGLAVAIKSIEVEKPCEMYDFVNSTTGKFSANGFVVHNSGAQGVLKLAMAQIEAECDAVFRDNGISVEPLLQVHDELIWDVDENYAEGVSDYLGDVMNNVIRLRTPLKSAASLARRWEK